ncbi:alkaline phosphatase D [[Emmonsia] crescens]|uniref:Alkaline phosphatase D n=1 Tax=[Emmonsia] crescens TaxID=73230 RepID=A0A2B7ZUQ2_9EURO|nr:alkaline phosphatase D [Emmonsia crescens]
MKIRNLVLLTVAQSDKKTWYRHVHKRNVQSSPFKPEELFFTSDVGSGDPYLHSVILWTRVSPTNESGDFNVAISGTGPLFGHDNEKYVAVSTSPVCVNYKVAKDDGMKKVVTDGEVWTSSDVDYPVKIEITGLKPYTTYYYQFTVFDSDTSSPIERTKTTPRKGEKVKTDINLSIFSCSNSQGFFNIALILISLTCISISPGSLFRMTMTGGISIDQVKANADAWDGYRANKNRTLSTILDNKIDNTIFLAGDTHASYVSDLVYTGRGEYDPKSGSGAIGVELGGSSVFSPGPVSQNCIFDKEPKYQSRLEKSSPLQWQDSNYRGYYELNINYECVVADFFGVPDIRTPNGKEIILATFEILDGANKLMRNEKGST